MDHKLRVSLKEAGVREEVIDILEDEEVTQRRTVLAPICK